MALSHSQDAFGTTNWIPQWVRALAAPIWVTTSEGKLSYLNARAEVMLGRRASSCLGRPCHQVVCGRDDGGRPFCAPTCPVRRKARLGKDIEPVRLHIDGSADGERWVQVLPIAVHDPHGSGPHIVHFVLDEKKLQHFEEYLTRVATRSRRPRHSSRNALTKREREILHLLAEDEPLHSIAARLHVSHVTVRNHVQHILSKLRVHSTIEAVACYLLDHDA